MTLSSALSRGDEVLQAIMLPEESPRHQAELLLQNALGIDRVSLYLRFTEILPDKAWKLYDSYLSRRLQGEPLQYIIGTAPFFGHQFSVGHGAFIPRFDSECIVERALTYLQQVASGAEILDLCCGTGAIGLSIASGVRNTFLTLLDDLPTPLRYAASNIRALGLTERVSIVKRDAREEFPKGWTGRFDLVVANPPYIPLKNFLTLPSEVRDSEPGRALTDDGDGLSFYRAWAVNVPKILKSSGMFITEIDSIAALETVNILSSGFARLEIIKDLAGKERAIAGLKIGQDSK